MNTDLINRLRTMRQDLSSLLEMPSAMTLAEPMRSRLSTLATSLAECEQQVMQMHKDQETHHARISTLARELAALGTPAMPQMHQATTPPADRPQIPDPSPASAPAAAYAAPQQNTHTPPPAAATPAAAEPSSGRFVADGVTMISRSTVSPTCEAFVFEITDSAGNVQQMQIETYRIDNEIFVKTRSPLPAADKGWMRGKDSYGDFFLCYDTRIASIADKKLRMAAGFALS